MEKIIHRWDSKHCECCLRGRGGRNVERLNIGKWINNIASKNILWWNQLTYRLITASGCNFIKIIDKF